MVCQSILTTPVTATSSTIDDNSVVSNSSSSNSNNSSNNISSSSSSSKAQGHTLFPWKLMDMLNECEQKGLDHIVSWIPHGKAFRVHDSKAFVLDIMPHHFKQTKYKSFQRQLNLWGFKRITCSKHPDKGAYWHKSFLKEQRQLCEELTRQNAKKQRGSANGEDEDQVPDFATSSSSKFLPLSAPPQVMATTTTTATATATAPTRASSIFAAPVPTIVASSSTIPMPHTVPSIEGQPHRQEHQQQLVKPMMPTLEPAVPTVSATVALQSVIPASSLTNAAPLSHPSLFTKELTKPAEGLSFNDIMQSLVSVPDLGKDATLVDIPMNLQDSTGISTNGSTSSNLSKPVSFEGCQFFLLDINKDEILHQFSERNVRKLSFMGTTAA